MRCIIFANGEYGELEAYHTIFRENDKIICADGGANYAHRLGLIPDCIIGDLDSILPEVKVFYEAKNTAFKKFPPRKDNTDMQLSMDTACEWGASEIILLGTLGKRLDHTLANLYSGMEFVRRGIKISHFTSECLVHIVNKEVEIKGTKGDIVSDVALTDKVFGFSEVGFEYSPVTPVLENSKPYAVSNVLADSLGIIRVDEGILAVFHYFQA
jgi:thiamine pyrophosphokinase